MCRGPIFHYKVGLAATLIHTVRNCGFTSVRLGSHKYTATALSDAPSMAIITQKQAELMWKYSGRYVLRLVRVDQSDKTWLFGRWALN